MKFVGNVLFNYHLTHIHPMINTHVSVRPYPTSVWGCLQVRKYKYTRDENVAKNTKCSVYLAFS